MSPAVVASPRGGRRLRPLVLRLPPHVMDQLEAAAPRFQLPASVLARAFVMGGLRALSKPVAGVRHEAD